MYRPSSTSYLGQPIRFVHEEQTIALQRAMGVVRIVNYEGTPKAIAVLRSYGEYDEITSGRGNTTYISANDTKMSLLDLGR